MIPTPTVNINSLPCPWCGAWLVVETVSDPHGLGGLDHICYCGCGMAARLVDVKAGRVAEMSAQARRIVKRRSGYQIVIDERRPYRLLIYLPELTARHRKTKAYRLLIYPHPCHEVSGLFVSCSCDDYVNSRAGTCKHCILAYQWLNVEAHREACAKAWGIKRKVARHA